MRLFLKVGIIIFLSLCSLVIIRIVLLFYKVFGEKGVSTEISTWGQTGDFFGGILNPIISLMSFALLAYLTWRISELEHERDTKTISPLPDLSINDYDKVIQVILKNFGLGPMIIKKIVFSNGITESENILNLLPKIPDGITYSWWNLKYNRIISPLELRYIIEFGIVDVSLKDIFEPLNAWIEFKPIIRNALKDISIIINYTDNINVNKEQSIIFTLEVFGSNLK